MANEADNTQDPGKKKLPLKMIIGVLAALIIEGVVLTAVFMMGGSPSEVKADGLADEIAMNNEQPVEILVIDGKFQNTRTGKGYLYDTEVYIVVRKKYEEEVGLRKEAMQGAINSDLITIFRRAEPAHLHEHELSTLTRQIRAALDERFGYDPDGEPYVQDCFLAEFKEFRTD